MLEIDFFSNVKEERIVTLFRRLMWIVLLLSGIILLDLYKVSFFDSPSTTELWNPLGLLFGPALYFGVCVLSEDRHFSLLKHLSPFFILGLTYIVVELVSDLHHSDKIVFYHYLYLLIPLSLWFYGFKAIKSLYEIKNDAYSRKVELLAAISIIYIINGIIYLLVFFSVAS